eukprot:TRINITY_DN9011_c0_g2_i1.p1 TRINITY_DN9011_c0_g2~~TRINITY_DN9011_c0_g2_i1.p1  ORF type:complete len:613 (+),score=138.99 TRINITY_DN9011_c0_g2_i1:135-1973(+)
MAASWRKPRNLIAIAVVFVSWVLLNFTILAPTQTRQFVATLKAFVAEVGSQLPLGFGKCQALVALDRCLEEPLLMADMCAGHCEEHLVATPLKRRAVFENMLTKEQCASILALAQEAAIPGDGYGGDAFPFTSREKFSGLTPVAAAQWAVRQPEANLRAAYEAGVRTIMAAARTSRQLTEELFNQVDPYASDLHFDYVQLSCRDVVKNLDGVEKPPEQGFFYMYADNCWQSKKNNTCKRENPYRHWRTYSMSVFLHPVDNETGGDIFFSADYTGLRRTPVNPQCGLAVVHDSGAANIHGVEALKTGRYCKLGVWLTNRTEMAGHARELEDAEAILAGEDPQLIPGSADNATTTYWWRCNETATSAPFEAKDLPPEVSLPVEVDGRQMQIVEVQGTPQISLVFNFSTPEENRHLMALAEPHLEHAKVFEGGTLVTAKYRTSRSAFLDGVADDVVSRLERRISLVTNLSLDSAESLQIAHYTAGNLGRYEPHMDWGSIDQVQRNFTHVTPAPGARVATFLLYLTDKQTGGDTFFTDLNLNVAPKSGMAVFWYNLSPSRQGLKETRHGACPIIKGEKFIATKWFHERGNGQLFQGGSATAGRPTIHRDWHSLTEA